MKTHSETRHTSIAIVGGGPAGQSLALALAVSGFDVDLIDRAAKPSSSRARAGDPRVTAINAATQALFEAIGAWQGMASDSCTIANVQVVDGKDGAGLNFGSLEQGSSGGVAHGAIVPNVAIARALGAAIESGDMPGSITCHYGTTIGEMKSTPGYAVLHGAGPNGAVLTINAALVCAADGAKSPLRSGAGIDITHRPYRQSAVNAVLTHGQPHDGTAFQRFTQHGPLALLPLNSAARAPHRSALVWSMPHKMAQAAAALDDREFLALLSDAAGAQGLGDGRGPFTHVGARATFPLHLMQAQRYHGERLALIGEAAHMMHPLAGQGFNLTARDIAELTDLLIAARGAGMDLGDPAPLARYSAKRRTDALALLATTDGINRVFTSTNPGIKAARKAGMAMVRALPGARATMMAAAQGRIGASKRFGTPIGGALPSLMRSAEL